MSGKNSPSCLSLPKSVRRRIARKLTLSLAPAAMRWKIRIRSPSMPYDEALSLSGWADDSATADDIPSGWMPFSQTALVGGKGMQSFLPQINFSTRSWRCTLRFTTAADFGARSRQGYVSSTIDE